MTKKSLEFRLSDIKVNTLLDFRSQE